LKIVLDKHSVVCYNNYTETVKRELKYVT
jgi:hypothetical protein